MRFLKNSIIVCLKHALEASLLIEKLIWITIGTVGTIYFAYLLVSQVNSWDENSVLVSLQQKSIDEIDFPALTFCTKSSTKYAIAERMGNVLDLDSTFYKKLIPLKNVSLHFYVKKQFTRSKTFTEKYEDFYKRECIDGLIFDEDIGCTVSLLMNFHHVSNIHSFV